jgi:hypothetical protein
MTSVVQQALEALKADEIRRVGGAGFKVILIAILICSLFVLLSTN